MRKIVLFCSFLTIAALASDEYRLNSGDKLEISVWDEANLHSEVVVLPDGSVSFPLIGHVFASGKTTEELKQIIKERLRKYIASPEVNIRMISADGNAVYVIGEVAHPGEVAMKGRLDVMQALSKAGGLTLYANRAHIKILRRAADGSTTTIPFEYSDVEDGDRLESNILLQSGDTIVVP